MADYDAAPAVVAEDLRALAEVVPFDQTTRELLNYAAELLEEIEAPRTRRITADPMPTGEEFLRRYSDPNLAGPAS